MPEEPAGQLPGGLGGALGGGLGGLLGGLAGAGGLEALIELFRQRGQGDVIDSWVGRGENRRIAPNQLEDALGPEAIYELQERILSGIAQSAPLREGDRRPRLGTEL